MLRVAVLLSIVYFICCAYGFQAFRTLFKTPWAHWAYIGLFLVVWGVFLYKLMGYTPGLVLQPSTAIIGGVFFSFLIFALLLSAFMLFEDVFRVAFMGYKKVSGGSIQLPSRRKFVSIIGLGLAALPLGALLYGMVKGKYNFKVLKYTMEFDDLPDAFDGYKITQISDVHSGSFDNHNKVAYAIDLVNKQQSDVILFTGDLVNNEAAEMLPWKDLFATLEAKDGKFSVLGNHDYGDYKQWHEDAGQNTILKQKNLEDLKTLQKEIGFDLLLNESRYLEKDGDRIALIGVENWGTGGFIKAGDLQKAKAAISKDDFKVLMSHDPSHWEAEIVPDDYHYHLTLSGHTHGMQFGIEIPGWVKWSPVKWRYTQWAGIYEKMGQYINVNRGFGFLGYPGRFGIWPEITVITLKKKALT